MLQLQFRFHKYIMHVCKYLATAKSALLSISSRTVEVESREQKRRRKDAKKKMQITSFFFSF